LSTDPLEPSAESISASAGDVDEVAYLEIEANWNGLMDSHRRAICENLTSDPDMAGTLMSGFVVEADAPAGEMALAVRYVGDQCKGLVDDQDVGNDGPLNDTILYDEIKSRWTVLSLDQQGAICDAIAQYPEEADEIMDGFQTEAGSSDRVRQMVEQVITEGCERGY